MANDTVIPTSIPEELGSLIEEIANITVPALLTDSTGIPLLSDTTLPTVLPPIGKEFVGCFAHRDLRELLAAMECRFALGLFVGIVLVTVLAISFACFVFCCYVVCRIRRRRKMRRNLTVRSDSMLDLALPKKRSPPGAGPLRASIHDIRIPRVSQRISAYGPANEEIFANEVAHRMGNTNVPPNANRFSSFSPYVPRISAKPIVLPTALTCTNTATCPRPSSLHSRSPRRISSPSRIVARSSTTPLICRSQRRLKITTMRRHLGALPHSTLREVHCTLARPTSCFEITRIPPMGRSETRVVREIEL